MISKIKQIEQPGFLLLGIGVRTNNQNGQSTTDLKNLWKRFMQEDILHKIPNRLTDDIYCLYANYETNEKGFYDAVLGCKVDSLDDLPDSFAGSVIPFGDYLVYSLSVEVPAAVQEAWGKIWASDLKRKYTFDYDRYISNAENVKDAKVKIYISV